MINSLSLSLYNWKVLLKSLICQLVILALIGALVFTFFGQTFDAVSQVLADNDLGAMATEIFDAISSGEFDSNYFSQRLLAFSQNLHEGINSVRELWGYSWVMYLVMFVVLVAYRMLVSVTDVIVGCQLDEYMTSNASRPFFWYAFKKAGKTWKFAFYQMLITLPLDTLVLFGSLGFFVVTLLAFGWWTVVPIIIIGWLLYSARLALCGYMLPSVVCCENLHTRTAIKNGLSAVINRFFALFGKTLVVTAVMFVGNGAITFFVKDSIVSGVSLSVFNFVLFYLIKCINFVDYFIYNNKPYFHKRIVIEGTDKFNTKQQRKSKRQMRHNAD